MGSLVIRREEPGDIKEVERVILSAFSHCEGGGRIEAGLVDALRRNPRFVPDLSFVALLDGHLAGHMLLFPVSLVGKETAAGTDPVVAGQTERTSLALAPLSVDADYQGRGVGTSLVRHGIDDARARGYGSVIVLGHCAYYARFGFRPSYNWRISAPFDVDPEVFMAVELSPGALSGPAATVAYPPEFSVF